MPSEVQILKESKARFEGVIFNQTADLGTNKSTSCKVIDEATGEVIAQSGGGGGESDLTTAEVTIVNNLTGAGNVEIQIPWLDPGATEPTPIPTMAKPVVHVTNGEEVTVNAVLYKGASYCFINSQLVTVETTGDIDYSEQFNDAMISGECTILLTGK